MTTLEAVEAPPLVVHLQLPMTDDQLFEFCQLNSELQIEREANGDILIMPPVGMDSAESESELIAQLRVWSRRERSGRAFSSAVGCLLPNGAMRSPDASWVRKSRLGSLAKVMRRKFCPVCPDFVAEIRSPSDRLSTLK